MAGTSSAQAEQGRCTHVYTNPVKPQWYGHDSQIQMRMLTFAPPVVVVAAGL
jgi:hypothetical protein